MSTNKFSLTSDLYDQPQMLIIRAQMVYDQARWQADLGRFKALFTGKQRMPTLANRLAGKVVRGQHARGLCSVEIDHIIGTESHPNDFDPDFNPLDDRVQDRWIRIATIRLNENELPAVDLLQVGEDYFVRDGHHRISVARALGYQFIDAQVTVLEI